MASKINVQGTFAQTFGATTAKTVTVAGMATVEKVVFMSIGTLFGGGYMTGVSNNKGLTPAHECAYKNAAASERTVDAANSIHIIPESGKEIVGKVATFGSGTFGVTFSKNDSAAVNGIVLWAARGTKA
jgi:hypothetical protein